MSDKKTLVTMDGNEAAAYIAYAFTEIAGNIPHYTVISHGRKNRRMVGKRKKEYI